MSDFFKKFLLEDPRRFGASGRYVGLAAFGKHPGWDDHVEDLGLETESLNFAKTLLYVNGIGGQIDSGAWEKLDPEQQLAAFKHLFVWQRSGRILIGRLWSSSDGKGRKRYPMVVCAHFIGVTLGWALKQALPALSELEQGCLMTTSAEEVRSLLNRKRAALREAIQSTDGRGEYAPVTPEALHKIPQLGGDGKSDGFLRVLYQIQSQLGTFASGSFNRGNPAALRGQQIRVPASAESPEQALLFWTRFFLTQIDGSVPLLLTLPLEASWLDVTVGEPESQEFFCLRASPKAVPMASEVPYKLDEAFRAKAIAFLEGFQRGETKAADLQPAAAPAVAAAAPSKSGWRKWLGVGVIVMIGAVAAMILLPKGGKQQATANAPEAKTDGAAKAAASAPVAASPTVAVDQSAKAEAAKAKARMEAEAEAARLKAEKRQAEGLAAAAKLKAEAEAAAKEKERQMAEASRIEKEKEATAQKELQEQRKMAEEAKKKIEEQANAKIQLAAVTSPGSTDAKTAGTGGWFAVGTSGELTNSIGMVLVSLPSGIWVGKFEVTQAEYQKVMGSNPSKSVNDRQPVERVGWKEANEFCRKLTELERSELPAGKAYSLPTEKQWKDFLGGQKFEDLPGRGVTFKGSPALVGQSGPSNKFGLFDVLGNVWEWCLDGGSGDEKLLKGGAFNSPNYDRTSPPDTQMSSCGFRCVLTGQ